MKEKESSDYNEEIVLAQYSYKALHKLIKSGMWKMYCNEKFEITSVEWSDAFRALLGFSSREDFPDTNEAFFTRVHKDDKKKLMEEYKKALSDTTGKIVYDTEFRAKTKNGTYRWFRTTGRITGTVERTFHGMIIDIDEKKEQMRSLYGETR